MPSQPKTITLAPGATITGVPFEIDPQGHFEWAYLTAFCVDDLGNENLDFKLTINDPGTRRDLMNEPIHAATICGTGRRPGILTETYLLNTESAGRQLNFKITNLHGGQVNNNIEIVLHGRRWYHKESPPDVQIMLRDKFQSRERTTHYWLTTDKGEFTLPPSGELLNNQAPTFTADDEADTEVFKITARSDAPFEFQLRELASNRTLMNNFVRVENGWGNAQFPFVFQESLLIERNYKVAFEIRNLHTQNSNTVFATMHARRLWYR